MAKKKPSGIKHKTRGEKKRKERIGLAVGLAILIAIISAYGISSMLTSSQEQEANYTSAGPRAAIVDQLSLSASDQVFIESATNTLIHAGYTVDYYPVENVTVEFYRNLPRHGYKIIVFRVHTTGRGAFFTSEAYSTSSYVGEQLNDQIWKVSYNYTPPFYFGISPSFVRSCMNGKFNQTVIVAMGCTTLQFKDMAEAFIQKGAKVYVGWTGSVLASHTDTATTYLLRHLLLDKYAIEFAINQTVEEVGPDPQSKVGSKLDFLPEESWDYTIQNP